MAMNSYVLSGLGGSGGSGIREPCTTEEPAVALPVTWWKGLRPPVWRGLRLCSWEWGDAVRAGPSGLRRGSAPWFLPQRAASARQSGAGRRPVGRAAASSPEKWGGKSAWQ